MSTLAIDTIQGATTATSVDMSGITNLQMPAGHVIQVLQSKKTNTFTTTSTINGGGYVDIPGLSVSITPASSSSKFLVMAKTSGMIWSHGHTYFRLVRDSTVLGNGDAAGSRATAFSSTSTGESWGTADHVSSHLDTPSTASQITYKVQGCTEYGTLYVNRASRDTDAYYDQRTSSEITVMEIAG